MAEYQAGEENMMTDALSRQFELDTACHTISIPSLDYFDGIHKEVKILVSLQQLVNQILLGELTDQCQLLGSLIFYKRRFS